MPVSEGAVPSRTACVDIQSPEQEQEGRGGGIHLVLYLYLAETYTAVGTPLCWRLTRCHRVLPSQVSYGWISRVGVGIK